MSKILILDSHSNAATACTQSLGRAGHELVCASYEEDAPTHRSKYCQRILACPNPLLQKDAYVQWLRLTLKETKFDYVLPTTDAPIYVLRSLEAQFLFGAVPVIPPESGFKQAFNKDDSVALAQKLLIPTPQTTSQNEFAQGLHLKKFPVFVKPVASKSWKGDVGRNLAPTLARDEVAYTQIIEAYGPGTELQVQEYFAGRGVGVEVLCDNGTVIAHFTHERIHEYPLSGGGSAYRKAIDTPSELLAAAEKMVTAMKWHGVAMFEFKLAENGVDFRFIEINGRLWGSLPLAIRSGVDFPSLLIDLYEGNPITSRPEYQSGTRSRSLSKELLWFSANWKADHTDPLLLTHPKWRSLFELFRLLTGKEFFDNAYLADLGPIASEAKRETLVRVKSLQAKLKKRRSLKHAKNQLGANCTSATDSSLLVLCYGNICRSPYVDVLLKSILPKDQFTVLSAGFHSKESRTSPEDLQAVVSETGVSLETHRSQRVTQEMINQADKVLIMDALNYQHLEKDFPSAMAKVVWLGPFGPSGNLEMQDPYGKSKSEMRTLIKELEASTVQFAKELLAHK